MNIQQKPANDNFKILTLDTSFAKAVKSILDDIKREKEVEYHPLLTIVK